MNITNIFQKAVNRPIEGVIKADDQDHLLTEMEEYVITKEIGKKITGFFSSYSNYQGANGVWISGFFGSGKSHLLKILSYVLENIEYEGHRLGDIFSDKISHDSMLQGDVVRATKIPSESVLFNIDQQAQDSNEDAVINIFYKVFNDHLGYFGAKPFVAEFERWLDSEGKYEKFKDLFRENANEDWTKGRRKYFAPKTKNALAQSLASINGDDPEQYFNIIKELQSDHAASVEDFCEKVSAYIATKEHGFRLNFFVDEVGQFISEDTRLMLNLQTIAETLATKCKGNAWVIATAQEDLEAIVGDKSALQKDDFSKIQGRFKIKIPLTSANVDEVIEKRLLAKNSDVEEDLRKHFEVEKANLNTLLSLSETGIQFRKYQNAEDFSNKFPFIPYQFDLFQQCIKELSKHNAFQGKHASVGERSMLGVFQEVLKDLDSIDMHTLVSFDQMFEGIRSTIRGEIQNAITVAERNLQDDFALKVLKVLFLVKYYRSFRTTARNISVLMLPSSGLDLKAHEDNIQSALNKLESQTYVQRNGDAYEYLTDKEQDVEREIQSMEIDDREVPGIFNTILFEEIIGDSKIRFAENKQSYEFTKKIDGSIISREKELTLEIITPNFDNRNELYYQGQTMGNQTLALFVLPDKEKLLIDIRLSIKTKKYYKQAMSSNTSPDVTLILQEKQRQNVDRERQLIGQLKTLLGEATVYINGTKHDAGTTADGKTKVINAFQDLVKLAYPNLKMLGSGVFVEDNIKQVIRSTPDDLFGNDDNTIGEAENEIYGYIVRRKKQAERTSLNDIRDHFTRKPYGWYASAIFTLVARLYKRGKIEAKQDSNMLNDEDFLSNLLNTRIYANTLLEPQMDFDQKLVRKVKSVYEDMFDENCPVSEARDIANAFKSKAKEEARKLFQLVGNAANYPFLASLGPLSEMLDKLSAMDYNMLIQQIDDLEDKLLDDKEGILDPINKFWNGEQKKIFDKIIELLNSDQSNFEFVDTKDLDLLRELRDHSKPYTGNLMKDAKEAMDRLRGNVKVKIEEERDRAFNTIHQTKEVLSKRTDYVALEPSKQTRILAPFDELLYKAKQQRYIATLRNYNRQAKELLNDQLNAILKVNQVATEPIAKYIRSKYVKVNFKKDTIDTPEEVEEYIFLLREKMMEHVKENIRINLDN